jgi:hypothetical protein
MLSGSRISCWWKMTLANLARVCINFRNLNRATLLKLNTPYL